MLGGVLPGCGGERDGASEAEAAGAARPAFEPLLLVGVGVGDAVYVLDDRRRAFRGPAAAAETVAIDELHVRHPLEEAGGEERVVRVFDEGGTCDGRVAGREWVGAKMRREEAAYQWVIAARVHGCRPRGAVWLVVADPPPAHTQPRRTDERDERSRTAIEMARGAAERRLGEATRHGIWREEVWNVGASRCALVENRPCDRVEEAECAIGRVGLGCVGADGQPGPTIGRAMSHPLGDRVSGDSTATRTGGLTDWDGDGTPEVMFITREASLSGPGMALFAPSEREQGERVWRLLGPGAPGFREGWGEIAIRLPAGLLGKRLRASRSPPAQ
jgi:hypothetical protein